MIYIGSTLIAFSDDETLRLTLMLGAETGSERLGERGGGGSLHTKLPGVKGV